MGFMGQSRVTLRGTWRAHPSLFVLWLVSALLIITNLILAFGSHTNRQLFGVLLLLGGAGVLLHQVLFRRFTNQEEGT